ncbi:hypothetical protein, partial [Sinorhizobium meliloti]
TSHQPTQPEPGGEDHHSMLGPCSLRQIKDSRRESQNALKRNPHAASAFIGRALDLEIGRTVEGIICVHEPTKVTDNMGGCHASEHVEAWALFRNSGIGGRPSDLRCIAFLEAADGTGRNAEAVARSFKEGNATRKSEGRPPMPTKALILLEGTKKTFCRDPASAPA